MIINYLTQKKNLFSPFLFALVLISFSCNPSTNKQNQEPNTANVDWNNKVIYEVNIRQYTPEGTFNAFEEHLPRLKELGVDILWLMPIFPIGEEKRKGNMGSYYAVKDYRDVNPEFGSMEDFLSLVNKIHEMGMFVILDWVANHTAWDNPLIYDHSDWYTHDSTGHIITPVKDWSDVADLDYSNQDMREYMMQSLEFWLSKTNVDGYRCDVAGMVPTDFWDSTRTRLNNIKPVFMLAEAEQIDLLDKAFDMDYGWWMMHAMNQIAKGEKDASFIDTVVENQNQKYQGDDIRMYFTTNHDENSWNGTIFERYGDAAKTFSTLYFTLNGMPLIYSGQEVGLNKRLSFFEKDTIDWTDRGFTDFYTKLVSLKHDSKALWTGENGGSFTKISSTNDSEVYSFIRQKEEQKVWVILNLGANTLNESIENDLIKGEYTELFTNETFSTGKKTDLNLKPWEYKVYVQ